MDQYNATNNSSSSNKKKGVSSPAIIAVAAKCVVHETIWRFQLLWRVADSYSPGDICTKSNIQL